MAYFVTFTVITTIIIIVFHSAQIVVINYQSIVLNEIENLWECSALNAFEAMTDKHTVLMLEVACQHI